MAIIEVDCGAVNVDAVYFIIRPELGSWSGHGGTMLNPRPCSLEGGGSGYDRFLVALSANNVKTNRQPV